MQNDLLLPKSENENRGYFFDISDSQILEHKSRSVADIFSWLENANRFIYSIQTPEEKTRVKVSKTIENPI